MFKYTFSLLNCLHVNSEINLFNIHVYLNDAIMFI